MKKNECLVVEAKIKAEAKPVADAGKQFCVVLLHGISANGEDLLPVALELQKQMPAAQFVLPHAPVMPVTLNDGVSMPSWYDIISLQPPKADCKQVVEVVDSVSELTAELMGEGYTAREIFVVGFSQGGSVALAYGMLAKQPPGGIVCISGFLPPCPKLMWEDADAGADKNPSSPILLMHGIRDDVVPFKYCLETKKQLDAQQPQLMEYDLDHHIGMQQIEDLAAWILKLGK